jgi:hypothetical protein
MLHPWHGDSHLKRLTLLWPYPFLPVPQYGLAPWSYRDFDLGTTGLSQRCGVLANRALERKELLYEKGVSQTLTRMYVLCAHYAQ